MLSSLPAARPAPPTVRVRSGEPVEVRTERSDVGEVPTQLLRQGRLWLVRGARRLDDREHGEGWRVEAGDGPHGRVAVLELTRSAGGWWLREVGW